MTRSTIEAERYIEELRNELDEVRAERDVWEIRARGIGGRITETLGGDWPGNSDGYRKLVAENVAAEMKGWDK